MTQATAKKPRTPAPHAPLPFKPDASGALLLGGRSAPSIAADYDAPVFVYDRAIIDHTFNTLRAALPDRVSIHYAVKANPFEPVVQHLAAYVDGIDVASEGELRAVRSAIGADMPISFAGPGKRDSELEAAIALDCTVNIESEGEMARLAATARSKGVRAKAAIRVNPPFDLRGSGMRMGGGAKPFGVDHDAVPGLLKHWPDDALEFQGFHIFTGSQSLFSEALQDAHSKALTLALHLAKDAPGPLRSINIGGGIGVPYFPGDQAVDVTAVGAGLAAALEENAAALGDTKVIVELGRYLVAEAGVYLTRIVDKKSSCGTTFLVTEGGMHHQLAVSGNFGQVFRKNYPVAIAGTYQPVGESYSETVTIVGCLCTPLDRLGDDVTLPAADVGDVVAVFRCGAYGPTASPNGFLNHPQAYECIV